MEHLETIPFGERLQIDRWRLRNGLTILLLRDDSAPVVSYQTWFRVGSSHEEVGKTGQAHLLEHLMFNETKSLAHGEFDRLLEAAGGETNAATWVDWTCYYENLPASEIALAIKLEADRMANLLLVKEKVASEKEVVISERRDRVEDDVEGSVGELLFATAFGKTHPYGWPTIGWMEDIESFTPKDCQSFYRTHYAPNAATLVVVGAIDPQDILAKIDEHYGAIPPAKGPASKRPAEERPPAPRQRAERRKKISWPTPTPKIAVGWHAPAYGSYDHAVLTVIDQLLVGGRSSRLWKDLVREKEIAAEVRMSLAPFRHAGLVDLWLSAREGKSVERCLSVAMQHIHRLQKTKVDEDELVKVKNRLELGFLSGLETVNGKADQIGFCETVVGDPSHPFVRLEEYRRVTSDDVRRVAREVFDDARRTIIDVVPGRTSAVKSAAESTKKKKAKGSA